METTNNKKICIITPGYISSSPRTVKEADALSDAGFEVRVVFSQGNLEGIIKDDRDLLKEKKWRSNVVKWSPLREGEKLLYWKSRLRHFAAGKLPLWLYKFGKFAECAEGRIYPELARLAAQEEADMYIGHYPAGLAAAAHAAFKQRARFGYDIEDLYSEEDIPKKRRKIISIIEKRYINKCSYVTVASEMFTGWVMKRHKIDKPLVVNNVFPLAERKFIDATVKDRRDGRLSLYWFSQTIGRNRGVEDAIRAIGLLKGKCQLHLRGYFARGAEAWFLELAEKCGVKGDVFFHYPVEPHEIFPRIAEHDVGLALEHPVSLNRRLCVCNKMLSYFISGLAVAATSTLGQKNILSRCPGTGFLYSPGNYNELAAGLNEFISNPGKLAACKKTSFEAAKNYWNWEKESKKLLEIMNRVLKRQ